jgi:hypothetical protein
LKRIILISLAVLLVALGGAAWWAVNSLDHIVKSALEHYGPQVLGVNVKVGQVEISAKNGRGVVRDLVLGNPSGYTGPEAVRVREATLALDTGSIGTDVVTVREISIDAPAIQYEIVGGKANLEVMQANIEKFMATKSGQGNAGQPGTAEQKKERRYIINQVNIRGAQVRVINPLLKDGGLSFTLPDISLRNIGREGAPVTAAEAARVVTQALVLRIAAKALSASQLLERGVEGVVDAIKGLFK